MSHPRILLHRNRTIRIDYPRLFRDGPAISYQEFLIRGFEVEEVVSVEVDRNAGSAVVHLHPRCEAATRVLARLAEKLRESRIRASALLRCPYFILQDKGGRIIYCKAPETVTGIRRLVYGGLGFMFFGLSIVGLAVPGVPTPPFVIVSSYFALRCLPRFNDRLLRSWLFGSILQDWHQHRALRRSTQKRLLIFTVILFSVTFGVIRPSASSLPIPLLLSLLSVGFVVWMPTVEDGQDLDELPHQEPMRLARAG